LKKHFNISEITQRWSSQYYESIDGLPYIGKFPGHSENILVATGFGGNGMVYSHVAAKIMANIILGKEDELDQVFSPSRIKPVTGFKNFVNHNVDVIKNFAGKLFETIKMDSLADLAPGEAKIIALDGHHAGVFKDDKDGVHVVNITCTHLGCSVRWNITEKSWDCPCHGARYSPDGKVLNGPATADLEYLSLESMVNSHDKPHK
jgi:Rieske Fe-S protein